MKVLWVVNSILNDLSLKVYDKPSNGLWMDALLVDFKNKPETEIIVATTQGVKKTISVKADNVTYYVLPDSPPILYNENKRENIAAWRELIEKEKPDVIQIWGTEFTHGLCCLRVSKGIPSVIYMQGYLGSIARYYRAGITEKELKKTVTIRDILKSDGILRQQKKYYRSAEKEKEEFLLAGAIISENDWCDDNIRSIVPDIKIYKCPLSVNRVFSERVWSIESAERHSIISNASGYTIKGLHVLLRAVALIKRRFPDVKLYVPGDPVVSDGSLLWSLRKRGYTKYIEKLIKELDIKDNIVWLGTLSQKDLAEQYSKRHVFAMPSAIENHSSSLKEAMAVGMPCVSSYVGGISEYVDNGRNGLLYRFEEYEVLAAKIESVFDSDALATSLSENARADMRKLHGEVDYYKTITAIYREMLCKK